MMFVPGVAIMLAMVLLVHNRDVGKERLLRQQQAMQAVEMQSELLRHDLTSVGADLLHLAGQENLTDFLLTGDNRAEIEEEYRLFSSTKKHYHQIRLLDTRGMELIRVNYNAGNPEVILTEGLQSKADRYYFRHTIPIKVGDVYISPFDLNMEHGEVETPNRPVIRFATPVVDIAGKVSGILVLNHLGQPLLDRVLAQSDSYLFDSWIINRDGYFLLGGDDGKEWAFMYGKPPTFIEKYPNAWEEMSDINHGLFINQEGLFGFSSIPATNKNQTLNRPEFGLKIISYAPNSVLTTRSDRTLRRLFGVTAIASILLFVLSWYLAHSRSVRRRNERSIASSEASLRKLSLQLMRAQEIERRSIARDLHDDLGQVVTAASLQLQRALLAGDVGAKNKLIEYAIEATEKMLTHLHQLVAKVRPSVLDDLGLEQAVVGLVKRFEHESGLDVSCAISLGNTKLNTETSDHLFRVIQEALTNVARHSGCSETRLTLACDAGYILLKIIDNGCGFDITSKNEHFGLLGIRERVELMGGDFSLKSSPGCGCEISVSIKVDSGSGEEQ